MNGESHVWLIPDCYLPRESSGEQPSHESICVVNTTAREARLSISFYFEDRESVKDIRVDIPPERASHLRTDAPEHLGGVEVPRGVPYAARVESDVPVGIQYSRMDTSQEALALMTAMGQPVR